MRTYIHTEHGVDSVGERVKRNISIREFFFSAPRMEYRRNVCVVLLGSVIGHIMAGPRSISYQPRAESGVESESRMGG